MSPILCNNSFAFISGKVYQIDEKGHCSEKFSTDGPVKSLFYYEGRDIILTVTDTLMLFQHRIDANGYVTELSKVCPILNAFFSRAIPSGDYSQSFIKVGNMIEKLIWVIKVHNFWLFILTVDF